MVSTDEQKVFLKILKQEQYRWLQYAVKKWESVFGEAPYARMMLRLHMIADDVPLPDYIGPERQLAPHV